MPRPLRPLLALVLACLGPAAACAGLQFDETEKTLKAGPQDKELRTRYTFANKGDAPVWIVQVTASCGCLAAVAEKTEIQPGENSAITATYTIGLSQGRHSHTIGVQTSEPGTPTHTLKFTAELPASTSPLAANVATLTPAELVWTRPPHTAKTVTIDLRQFPTAKISASSASDQFELRLDESVRPATLHVSPLPSVLPGRYEIDLLIAPPDRPPLTLKIPLTVVSLRTPRPSSPAPTPIRSDAAHVAYPVTGYICGHDAPRSSPPVARFSAPDATAPPAFRPPTPL